MAEITLIDRSTFKARKLLALPGGPPLEPGKRGDVRCIVFPAEPAQADTLRDLVTVLNASRGITLVPHEFLVQGEPRFFEYTTVDKPEAPAEIVDIHLVRQGEELCLKQNLDFRFMDDDVVLIISPAC